MPFHFAIPRDCARRGRLLQSWRWSPLLAFLSCFLSRARCVRRVHDRPWNGRWQLEKVMLATAANYSGPGCWARNQWTNSLYTSKPKETRPGKRPAVLKRWATCDRQLLKEPHLLASHIRTLITFKEASGGLLVTRLATGNKSLPPFNPLSGLGKMCRALILYGLASQWQVHRGDYVDSKTATSQRYLELHPSSWQSCVKLQNWLCLYEL